MAGQAPIHNPYPNSLPDDAWNGQELQQPYYEGDVPEAHQQLNMGFLKRFPSMHKKTTRDGQVPKRRGPKPDSKPAQTRRQELNRQAQRTHRERKEQYIKALEMELDRFKEVYLNDMNQANHVRRENALLREILASRGINADEELAERAPTMMLEAGNSMALPHQHPHPHPHPHPQPQPHGMPSRAMTTLPQPYPSSQPPSAAAYSPMGTQSYTGGSSAVSVAGHSPVTSMHSYGGGGGGGGGGAPHSSSSGPETQEFAVKQKFDAVPALPGIFEHNPQLAVDFILQLEHTCRDHEEYLVRRSVESPDTPAEAQFSGHALMASIPPVRHVREVPAAHENADFVPTHPHQMADTETLQLLQNLLRTSSEAKHAMNLLGGQVTPVMALQSLRNHRYYHSLKEEDVRKMIEAVKGHVRCYGFGAVMEDFELRDALDIVFATKPEAYQSIRSEHDVDEMYS